MLNTFALMSIKHTQGLGVRIWEIGDDLYLVLSSAHIRDEDGVFFKKGWQIYMDAKTDSYVPRSISRMTAKRILYGIYHETLTKKRLKEKN